MPYPPKVTLGPAAEVTYSSALPSSLEKGIIDHFYVLMDRLVKYNGEAHAPWIVQQTALHYEGDGITIGTVNWLMWELIETGKMKIDFSGMLTSAETAF